MSLPLEVRGLAMDRPNPSAAAIALRWAGRTFGIRSRVSALMLLAVAPLTILLAASAISDRRIALEHARLEVQDSARLAAQQQATAFNEAQTLLSILRLSPEVGIAGGAACNALVKRAAAEQNQFRTIGVVAPDGQIVCHNTLQVRQEFGDLRLLQAMQALGADEFQIGRFSIGRVTHKPTIISAIRLPQANGPPGLLFASLILRNLSSTAESEEGGFRSVLAVVPETSTVIDQAAVRASLIGRAFPDHPLMMAMRSHPYGGVIETENFNGRPELIGFAPLPRTSAGGAMIAVGVSRATALAAANHRAFVGLAVALGTTMVVLAVTWWLGYWTQIRPIRRLAKTAKAIGDGTLSARATIEPWQAGELRFLGDALDAMAERLSKDMTERKKVEETLALSEVRFRLLAENTADLITRLDKSGRRIFASPASRELLGYEPEELLGGSPLDLAHPDDAAPLIEMLAELQSGKAAPPVQYRAQRQDGVYVWVETSGRPLGSQRGVVLAIRDISRRKLAEDQLAAANLQLTALAREDGLTGLANRRSFDEMFKLECARAGRDRQPFALLLADVDKFKIYNDTYGHPAGDEVLRSVSRALQAAARRPGDLAARYGGEEFAAVLPGTDLDGALRVAEAFRAAVEAMATPHIGSTSGVVTVSVGVVAIRPRDKALRQEDVVRQADEALYAAKAAGRNRVLSYRDPAFASADGPLRTQVA